MDLFDVLTMIGGLSIFLFGMSVMGQALERAAGNRLKDTLGRMTGNTLSGFLTGLGITAVIQSSSATTVMVVGFVNSGLLTLRQAINVIMGANVGTTVTAWLLSLGGISGSALWVRLLKPSSFSPVLALVGVILLLFGKSSRKKDIGTVLLGFATLMLGMETMTGAVSGLKDVEGFRRLFLLFTDPLLGVLAGAVLTGVIQSSSASVGILQALAVSGSVSYGAAIPIIMGQNIGTCVTALLSSVGTTRNARRTALVHLAFNVIGTAICLAVFCVVKAALAPPLLQQSASMFGIAVAHSAFNIVCTAVLLPAAGLLERLVVWLVPEGAGAEKPVELDQRLLATPAVALRQSRVLTEDMSYYAVSILKKSLAALEGFSPADAEEIRHGETATDHYEDVIGTYLLKLSSGSVLSDSDGEEITELLKLIGDFERIGDHAVNILESAEELKEKGLRFSETADRELSVLCAAVGEVLDTAQAAFLSGDMKTAALVEPLEQVIDELKNQLRNGHILRMKNGACSIEAGFIWSDLLTDLERVSDHCSNVALCVIERQRHSMNMHDSFTADSAFRESYLAFKRKYTVAAMP